MRLGCIMAFPEHTPRLLAGLAVSAALHATLLACHCVDVLPDTLPPTPSAGVLQVDLARRPTDISGRSLPDPEPTAAPGASGSLAERPSPARALPQAALLPLPAALYLPARELTRRPQVAGPVELDSPAFDAYSTPGKLTLRLFVNESGGVDAIAIDATDLPPAFAERAQAEFSRARVQPGEKDGQRVKSQLRIEVSFDPR